MVAKMEYRCLSALGMLGYGINADSLKRGMERKPHMLGADAGSTDAGPQKLGAGIADVSRSTTVRDLRMMIQAGRSAGIPVIIGSAGGSGAAPHVAWTWDIVREIARTENISIRTAIIHADLDLGFLRNRLAEGKVIPLGPVPPLSEDKIQQTLSVVGQMGTEPIAKALDMDAELIIAGRACDAAIFAAPAIRAGADPGLAWHMGEILECGAMCADPGSAGDCMLGTIEHDRFTLEPTNPMRRCTPVSVAAHSLYERSHPTKNGGPGHVLDVSKARFEALNERKVAIYGSRLIPEMPIRIKLEGAGLAGYRTMVVAGIRDPIAISRIDEMLDAIKHETAEFFDKNKTGSYSMRFIVYGRDGVMGPLEPTPEIKGHEIGLVLDVVAESQEVANTVCAYARAMLQHYYYKGIRATGANLAFPTAPSDTQCGRVFRFTIHHLIEVSDPCELFPVEIRTAGN